ncbi:MAG TPA: HAMP domain-containing sensor histidine kinase [Gemmatimonadaceae bacterium]|jgi:signal transduction histidine kinase|nr:HAMP domain-containing sensor histidine kinase [Gemmatimonadaceae bacterium]
MLGRWWWAPSAFVVLALLALFITPIVVENRVRGLRTRYTDGTERARVLLNDLEASFASLLLLRNQSPQADDTTLVATRTQLEDDEAGLRAATRDLGPTAAARLNELSNRLHYLDSSPRDGDRESSRAGLDLLATAEKLDAELTAISTLQRIEIRRLEFFNVVSAAVLASIALVAMGMALWSGRRVLKFAGVAERERAQVVRAAEARAALLRGVTHDVKNPLGAAAGYAQLLEESVVGPLSAPQLQMVRRIHRLVGVSVQTVTDLLELARADGGDLPLEYADVDLATIVAEAVDDHRALAQEQGLSICVTADATPVVTDPTRVQQVLANLLSNAVKYTPNNGTIRVRIVREQRKQPLADRVGVEIRDTGPGIPAELRGRVFDEFFRVRTASAAANGNGLGLAISLRIARLLGGDVTYADNDGGGSVFTLWLPRAKETSVN